MQKVRNNKIDNGKALLSLLVLLGHLYEKITFPGSELQYFIIYSFHMPLFILLSGFCHNREKKNDTFKYVLYPYLVVQTITCLFEPCPAFFATGKYGPIVLQYSTPIWVLWYLLALFIWNLVTDSLSLSKKDGLIFFAGSVMVSILAGFFSDIGYYFSLSRILAFYPFYLAGVWLKKWYPGLFDVSIPKNWRWASAVLAVAALTAAGLLYGQFPADCFYNAQSYEAYGCQWWVRAVHLLIAASVAPAFIFLLPDRNLPLFTRIGRNSLFVYLIQMIFIRALPMERLLEKFPCPVLTVPLLAIALALLFSLPCVSRYLGFLVRWPFSRRQRN